MQPSSSLCISREIVFVFYIFSSWYVNMHSVYFQCRTVYSAGIQRVWYKRASLLRQIVRFTHSIDFNWRGQSLDIYTKDVKGYIFTASAIYSTLNVWNWCATHTESLLLYYFYFVFHQQYNVINLLLCEFISWACLFLKCCPIIINFNILLFTISYSLGEMHVRE